LEVEQSRQFAKLYAYLKFPWPRTQMLANIAKDLPPQVTLRELTIVEETTKSVARRGVTAVGVTSQSAASNPPAEADLALLRSQQDQSRTEIQISGTTTNSGALHLFVMALNGTPLFESAKLHSLEAVAGSRQPKSNFYIRLTVRPGYGQSGGPQTPPAIVSQVIQSGSSDRS
jgi:Tfp pilus assembly protein PilN